MLNRLRYSFSIKSLCRFALVQTILLWQLQGRAQQIANYVANGSFEERYDCLGPSYPLEKAKHWLSIDSVSLGGLYISTCNSMVPHSGLNYQYPKTGESYILTTLYYVATTGYLKNRLKSTLQAGKTYCVKFYVNIKNGSTYGMDGFAAYFGDNTIDTITKCNIPLSYLNPQVKNPQGNIITDTLNWVPITGTFVANGTEKYMVIGNFLPHNSVDTLLINPTLLPEVFTDVLIDDASCIDIDLPAYAGPDKPLIAGDSVYIGRELDFAVDSACAWFQLPDTTTPIKKASGLWVKPVITTTYVVKQEIYCGTIKWDTVIVFMTATGIHKSTLSVENLILSPNPSQDQLLIEGLSERVSISVFNNLGQLMREEELQPTSGKALLLLSDLFDGVYMINITSSNGITITKKLLIAK